MLTPEEQHKAVREFVSKHATRYDSAHDDYERPPFASDVRSPGRSKFYNLHYYLTKVPPESIVQLLLHYTRSGDLVMDPFAGSGMMGVACQMCASPDPTFLESTRAGQVGPRNAILSDLSPAACHISYNYTHPADPERVLSEFERMAQAVRHEIGSLYATDHFVPAADVYDPTSPEVRERLGQAAEGTGSLIPMSHHPHTWKEIDRVDVESYLGYEPPETVDRWLQIPATLVYVVWSDVYRCEGMKTIEEPTDRINRRTGKRVMAKRRVTRGCKREIVARGTNDRSASDGNNAFLRCPHPDCHERWMKGRLPRVRIVPVEECLEYTGLVFKRGEREPKRLRITRPVSANQVAFIEDLGDRAIPYHHPMVPVNKDGPRYRRDSLAGKHIERYPDFFTHRNLWALALLWSHIETADNRVREAMRFCFTSQIMRCSRLRRMKGSKPGEQLSGTLHIASETAETNVWRVFAKAVTDYCKAVAGVKAPQEDRPVVYVASATKLDVIPDETVDYVFTDPPFGSNIYYSDVSYMWEAWLDRFTDEPQEAIMHRPVDGGYKRLEHYAALMDQAFAEIHRVLKPGRHATIEFNNSDGRVFEVIKNGLTKSGLVIENMLVFDKVERTYAQIRSTAGVSEVVDKDVLFNVLKPRERRGPVDDVAEDTENAVVDAITVYLGSLPLKIKAEPAKYSDEHRTTATINSVLMNTLIPQGVGVKQLNLPFIERVCARYFRKVGQRWYLRGEAVGSGGQAETLVEEEVSVRDEVTAIEWLRQKIRHGPSLIGELKPLWMRATGLLPGEVTQDLILEDLLTENFWRDADTNRWREPTDEERERMNDDRSIRVLHDAERYVDGQLKRRTTDTERCEWIDVLFQACRACEDNETQSVPALRGFEPGEGYRLISRLFQSILREKVAGDAYGRAEKQARVASQRISREIDAEVAALKEQRKTKDGPTLFDQLDDV